ncbi:MAG: hypothetical protein WCW16_00010 [Candidatus Magasanikbacteria bacterium]
MDYSIISYVALGIILIIGSFIAWGAFKLNEKNFPLEPDEKVLYEELGVRLTVTSNAQANSYRKIRLKITNKRMFIFTNGPWLHSVIVFGNSPSDATKQELKGISYVQKTNFKIVPDTKHQKLKLHMEYTNFIGFPVSYVFDCPNLSSVQTALGI